MEQGDKECHDSVVATILDVPEEVCDLNPVKTCRFATKLLPHLSPQHQCTMVPKEVCVLKFNTPKQVKKQFSSRWCLDTTTVSSDNKNSSPSQESMKGSKAEGSEKPLEIYGAGNVDSLQSLSSYDETNQVTPINDSYIVEDDIHVDMLDTVTFEPDKVRDVTELLDEDEITSADDSYIVPVDDNIVTSYASPAEGDHDDLTEYKPEDEILPSSEYVGPSVETEYYEPDLSAYQHDDDDNSLLLETELTPPGVEMENIRIRSVDPYFRI